MHPTNRMERQTERRVKGLRRLRIDIAEHSNFGMPCPCKDVHLSDPRGRIFARFADHATICSCTMCGNPRRSKWTPASERGTWQERRAAVSAQEACRDL